MQIKSAKASSFFNPLFFLGLALLGLVVLTFLMHDSSSGNSGNSENQADSIPQNTVEFMRKKVSFFELLSFFNDHTILLAVKDDASVNLTQKTRDEIAKLGGTELAQLQLRDSYVGRVENGKIIAERKSNSDSALLNFSEGKVESASYDFGDYSKVSLGDMSWSGHNRGLNAFVVSKTGTLLGIWNFDYFKEKSPVSATERFIPTYYDNVPVIEIELKEKHFAKLEKKRDDAVKTKLLISAEDDLVPANIIYDGKMQKADIRLKGDWIDHLDGDNWSFRVKMKGGQTLRGMRKFSLHRPETRNYAGEWLFHQVLKKEDILNLQYDFVQVILNIKSGNGNTQKRLGVYALEEFFDKHLVERSQRREGVILKVDESAIWDERAAFYAQGVEINEIASSTVSSYENLPVLPFGKSKVMQDSGLFRQFETGAALFRDFLSGKKLIHEVFDVERLAKYTAVCNLLGANHGLVPHNVRVYFNPLTSRLEPIGFDGNAWSYTGYFSPYYRTADDLVYQAAYLGALEEITEENYLEDIMKLPGLDEKLELMALVNPELEHSFELFNVNRATIRNSIFPERSLKVYYEKIADGYMHLTVENFGRFPVEILGVENEKQRSFGQPEEPFILPKGRKSMAIKLDKSFERLFVKKSKGKYGFDVRVDFEKIKLSYKTLGTSRLRSEEIYPWTLGDEERLANIPSLASPNAHEYDFLTFDEIKKTITAKPGHWTLASPLIIPSGYTFIAGPGTRFDFKDFNGRIISQSALDFRGTADSPVEVISSTRKGLGVFVYNTPDTSHLEHCEFTNLSNPATKGWALSGAVNFYEAPVILRHCHFSKNRCEDALNIFRSWFDMENIQFTDIYADAFDGDFVNGTVKNCQFTRIGNDGVDVSGSDISVENIHVFSAGDKGLSAGEDSRMRVTNSTVENSAIAVASKDRSTLTISHSTLKNNGLAYTAFQKKPEFGPAKIISDSLQSQQNKVEFLIETGSSLLLEGKQMPTESGVVERMYGEEFGKKSG